MKIPDLFQKYITHGVYVISVANGSEQNAFTAAWVMQVSFDPPMIAISINPANYSYKLLEETGVCTINVLGENQLEMAAHFGSSGVKDKMSVYKWQAGKTFAPILSDGLAYFDCQLSHMADAGDHKIAVCRVETFGELNPGCSLLYRQTGNLDGSSKLYKR
jgi:flavin reductase (DIM6/NTAB) family NADH-FMN oxidoreductase RutF